MTAVALQSMPLMRFAAQLPEVQLAPPNALTGLIMKSVVPASTTSKEKIRDTEEIFQRCWGDGGDHAPLKERFTPHHIEISIPDEAELHGTFYQNNETANKDIPTLILFNGNGDAIFNPIVEQLLWHAEHSLIPFNMVNFDYRGVGRSRGSLTTQGMVRDGQAVYQFVTQELKISQDNTDLYGLSLGGGVAAMVKAAVAPDTEGKLIIDRSYLTLVDAIKAVLNQYISPIGHLGGNIAGSLGVNLDSKSAIPQIRSPKLIFNALNDPVIPRGLALFLEAELVNAILEKVVATGEMQKGENPHCVGLDRLIDTTGRNMLDRVFEFIAEGRSYEDTYLKEQFPTFCRNMEQLEEILLCDDLAVPDKIRALPSSFQEAIKYQVHVLTSGEDGDAIVTHDPQNNAVKEALRTIMSLMPFRGISLGLDTIKDRRKDPRERILAFKNLLELDIHPSLENPHTKERFSLGAISEEEHNAILRKAYHSLADLESTFRMPFRNKLWELNGHSDDAKNVFERNPRDPIVLQALNVIPL